MKGLWKIANWEITRNLTNKQFIIGLLLTPVLMGLFAGVPILLDRLNQPSLSTYYVVDHLGELASLQALLPENIALKEHQDSGSIADVVRDTNSSGYFTLDQSFITTGQIDVVYNDRSMETLSTVKGSLTALLQQIRLAHSDISLEQLAFVNAPAQVREVALDEELEPQTMHMIVAMVFTVLVFFLILTSGTMLMQSALQEKRDRMAEVVLSSVRSVQLMQGKILGHFLLGLMQLIFWIAIGLPIARYFWDFSIMEALAAVDVPVILFFGLGGYLLYSALFVGLGATMEDLQSASNSQSLVIMLPALSFLFLGPVISNPDGTIAVFASIFPFTSPAIMMLRSGLTVVPLWQTLGSAALLLLTAWVIILLASKIFRIGMLMYGKNASFKEVVKWIHYKES
jgi:ABC-2 type transport system permease protein